MSAGAPHATASVHVSCTIGFFLFSRKLQSWTAVHLKPYTSPLMKFVWIAPKKRFRTRRLISRALVSAGIVKSTR